MRELSLQSNGQLTANQIINEFLLWHNDAANVKNDLIKIFMGFYISENSDNMDKHFRADIAFSFSRVMDLLTNIEKYKKPEDLQHEDFSNEIPEHETKKAPELETQRAGN